MTKREAPDLLFDVLMVNGSRALFPAAPWVDEALMQYAIGARVTSKEIRQDRSKPHHNLYWGVLSLCVENSENKYGSAEDLHGAIKVALGYRREIKLLSTGEGRLMLTRIGENYNRIGAFIQKAIAYVPKAWRQPIIVLFDQTAEMIEGMVVYISDTLILPGSISFSRMDQAEFKVFFDRAMGELTKAGYPVEEYIEIVKTKLVPYRGANNGRIQKAQSANRGIEEDAEAFKAAA